MSTIRKHFEGVNQDAALQTKTVIYLDTHYSLEIDFTSFAAQLGVVSFVFRN
jgi:hypothetical protein